MTIFGWDASHFDAVPDGAKVVSSGIAFTTHKAGGDASDGKLAAWWAAMRPYRDRVLLGAYWILRPDLQASATASADAFLTRLNGQCPGWQSGPFILQADCEIWNQNAATKPSQAYITTFCNRLASAVPKLRPIVYASHGQYGNSLAALDYPLWNANYPSNALGSPQTLYAHAGGDAGPGWLSYSGQTPIIWQFAETATIAGQTTCDADAFRGTLAELITITSPGWETDVAVTAQDITNIAQGVASKLYNDLNTPASGLAKIQGLSEQRIVSAVLAGVTAALAAVGNQLVTQDQLNQAVYAALKLLAADAA